MNISSLRVRRTLTLGGTLAALVLGFAVIQSAAAWAVDAAPLASTPVSAVSIQNRLVEEQTRSADLQSQLWAITDSADQLSTALEAAQTRIATDTDQAAALRKDLKDAKSRLATLKESIRQARSTTVVTKTVRVAAASGTSAARHGGGEDDGHERDDHEPGDD
jgi:peptidoglycan hydrolase CwlO-like protein